ncbi:MAG: cob(I)yrinic acid a,c-diamide adenosyltransferase [Myxococcota bacterium]|nr:cob(I)yrinic acid a,c-diamide adenosyltransferase [Myxococcota bacterium]
MKIYTRRGDGGDTDLAGGTRISKDALRVEAYGAVDELNAFVGLAIVDCDSKWFPVLEAVQRTLFEVGAGLATPPSATQASLSSEGASEVDVESIEAAIDEADNDLPPLRAFVLPGGCRGAAAFHAARTVCRRAERRVVALDRVEHLNDSTLHYLNRLSDLLFVLARSENVRAGEGDVEWTRRG